MAEKQYIEREAVLAEIEEAFRETDPTGEEQIGLLNGHRIVRIHPAADVAPVVHGEWIPHDHMSRSPYARNYDCSVCGNSPIENGDFCNKCGARMDGGKHG